MDPIELAEKVANEIQESLGDNHISTLVFGGPVVGNYVEGKTKIPIFTVVDKFDQECAKKMSVIAKKWSLKDVDGPYIMEMDDIEGMSDSIPEELLDIMMNYQVLEGMDVIKAMPKINQEHLRAQAELAVRRYIYNLRYKLTQVIGIDSEMEGYLNNLAFYSQLSIRIYHRLTYPWIKSTEEHLEKFVEDFPDSKDVLKDLLNHVYRSEELKTDPVTLSTQIIDTVLQPMLQAIDAM